MDVTSPVAGLVNMFYVEDGAQVGVEDSILMIESMKVGFDVKAPVAGQVHLKVNLGQTVKRGDVVATI